VPLAEVGTEAHRPISTRIGELDRVLSGGLLPGSATLLGGEPGTGKSTLLLQGLASMAKAGRRCLLVAAEEAAPQIRRRASRVGADVPGVFVVEATELVAVEAAIAEVRPDVAVVDSVQAIGTAEVGSPPGSPAQVMACAASLANLAKAARVALVLVGHVTKEGSLAGPRTLEHLVDTVLSFEGDRYLALRALRAVKHRFGPTGETGLFEMGERGLSGVADPSALFLGDRLPGAEGSAVAVPIEGHRPVLVEVQALVGRAAQPARRSVTGLDPGRVSFLVAVLESRAGVKLAERELYLSVAGGARACEPAADLAICLALSSSAWHKPVPPGLVAVGEVGLGGEVRRVTGLGKRLEEASRLGFAAAVVPAKPPGPALAHLPAEGLPKGVSELGASTLRQALSLTFARLGPEA
jgi:DNA repair protein RadA/Sms